MSKNINQVFIANPITTNASTDLMYFGQSPYGAGNDAAMTYANFSAQFTLKTLTNTHIYVGNASNIATDVAMSGDATIANTGAVTLANTAVTPATYTVNGSNLFTVDGKGRITSASNITVSAAPSGSAGGDLSGTYPNPTVAQINGVGLGSTTATSGNLLIGSGTQWVTRTVSGDATINSTGAVTFATVNSNVGTFGDATHVAQVTVNGKGLITAVSSIAITSGTANVNQNTSSATLAANSRYATNNGASLVTYTIPAGAAVGDTYMIVGGSSGGWTIAQPASVQCHVGSSATTSGVGGSISSSNQYDCCTVTCVASNVFTVYGVQGALTIV